MGVIATAKVVTSTDRQGRPRTVQPGNREWVTIIKAISANGFIPPPLVIVEAVMHQLAWYENGLIPLDWSVAVSEKGWTSNEIGLYWLEHVFNKHTKSRTVGTYRLLILDGHGSHATPEFDQYCLDQKIIVLCMPAHSSHLLQPLDVGCFAALKRSYGGLVKTKMRLGVNHIDKQDFLLLYQQARAEALHERGISEAVLQQQASYRTTQIAYYRSSRLKSRRRHYSYSHSLINYPIPQRHPIISRNYNNKQSLSKAILRAVPRAHLPQQIRH
jgi:hypothetical protein